MKRRATLAAVGTALTGAGCLGVTAPRQTRSRLAWLWFVNDREEAYTADVEVTDDGETVFAESYELGTGADDANVYEERPVDGPGQYVVRATLDGETRAVDTTAAVDGDEDCVGVRFTLLDNGSVDYWTKSMREC